MRIAFLDQYSEIGGAQACLTEVLAAVAERGWRAAVWAPGDGPLHARAREHGFEARSLPLGRYSNFCKSVGDVARYTIDALRSRQVFLRTTRDCADVVYVNGPRALPCVFGWNGPVVFHSHSVLDRRYSRWIARQSLHSSAQVLTSSRFLASQLGDLFGARVRVIYNGVPDYGFGERRAGSPTRVGIVGRIAPEKGQIDFLRAAQLLARQPKLEFQIIGEAMFGAAGYGERVYQTARELGVRLMGWRDPAEIYRGLDILAVPSAVHDANPRVAMEAMATGVRVVAYRSGGIAELVSDGHDGLVTDRTPEALASSLAMLAYDPALQQRLRVNGRRTYEQRFTVQRFQHEVCEAIAGAASGIRLASIAPRLRPQAKVRANGKSTASS
jgi:glycosyltransferase involved in cell wall biosynthesis